MVEWRTSPICSSQARISVAVRCCPESRSRVFDAWEHAFYLQYKNQKVDFIDAMWAVVNWQDVAKRYEAAKSRTNTLLLALART